MTSNCTELLRLHPQQPDGPMRESLTSLLIRIARENDVSPASLLELKFSGIRPSGGFRVSSRAFGQSIGQSVNGLSDLTRGIAMRLEELTGLAGVVRSTTVAFAPFATINGLLRQNLAWSPNVLAAQETRYYPLLWALDPVRVCPVAKKPLTSLCPKCRRPLVVLSGGSHIGRCSRCHIDLSSGKAEVSAADPVASSIRNFDYELWVAEQLGEFIAFQSSNALPVGFSYTDTLRFWLEKFELSISRKSAAALGATQCAMSNWIRGGTIPRLRMTLNLCWVFQLSLLQFLQREVPNNHSGRLRKPVDQQTRHNRVSRRRRIDRAGLEHDLSSILRENRYAMMPFREICRKKLGRRDIVVRQNFPELARAIAKRYFENRRIMAQVRQEQFCAGLKAVARSLHARGVVPNHKTLAPFMDRAGKLRSDWAINALREVRMELGYEDEGEQLLLPV